MECNSCKAAITETAKFCPECGSKVLRPMACSVCGVELEPRVKFCPECGTHVHSPAGTQPLPPNTGEKSKGNTPPDTSFANGVELDYRFFDSLKDGYYSALMTTLGDTPEDLHSCVKSRSKDILHRDIDTGIKGMLVALTKAIKGVLPSDTIQAITDAVQQKVTSLLSGWQNDLDRMEQTGNQVLQEVPCGMIDGLIKGAQVGLTNVGTGTLAAGPFGTIGGIAKSFWDGHQMEKRHEILTEAYQNAQQTALERVDRMWEELYNHIHTLLKDQYRVKTLSHTEIQELYEDYTESLKKAEERCTGEQYEDALPLVDRAIRLCPGETYPYLIRGQALGGLKRWEGLISAMDELRGLGNVPKSEELLSHFYSGCAHSETGEVEKAIAALRKVTLKGNEDLPYYPEAHFGLACCYADNGDQKRALTHLQKAVDAGYKDLAELQKEEKLKKLADTKEFNTIVDALRNRVANIVEEFLLAGDQEDRIFRRLSEFEKEKLSIAKDHYAKLKKGEKILAIYDSTVFGGAKEGICFTNEAVYWKCLLEEPVSFRYADITSITDSEDGFEINGEPFCSDASECHEQIARMLRKICRV